MEIGSIGKSPAVAPVWSDLPRPAPLGTVGGVGTDLAPRQAVTQATNAASTGTESRRADPASTDTLERRVVIDTATRQIVYQSVDDFTGQVVKQTPDQALLRQRAYFIQQEDAKAAAAASAQVEVERRV